MVSPASIGEAEKNFSALYCALRRLKTYYLRSTKTQESLNNIAVCHVQCSRLCALNVDDVIKDFISLNDCRGHTFGKV